MIAKLLIFIVCIGVLVLLIKNKPRSEKKAIDYTDMKKDPICDAYVEEFTPHKLKYEGNIYYFCSKECMDKFRKSKIVEDKGDKDEAVS
jgi:YHS domain-containing protein